MHPKYKIGHILEIKKASRYVVEEGVGSIFVKIININQSCYRLEKIKGGHWHWNLKNVGDTCEWFCSYVDDNKYSDVKIRPYKRSITKLMHYINN